MKYHLHILGLTMVMGVALAMAIFLVLQNFYIGNAQTSGSPEIIDVKIVDITSSTATIQWDTNKPTDATINYGLDSFYGIARDPDFENMDHEVTLQSLEPSTRYFFRIISADESANQAIAEGFTFTTRASKEFEEVERIEEGEQRTLTERVLELLDQIDDLEALEVIAERIDELGEEIAPTLAIIGEPSVEEGSDRAVIRWQTDREANTLVDIVPEDQYNSALDNPYTITQGDPDARELEHIVEIVGLQPATTYHFRVRSQPIVGPEGVSRDRTFTTTSILPALTSVEIERVQEDSATIRWRTNVPTAGLVRYTNLTTGEELSAGDPTLLAAHTVQLKDLDFATRYSVIVEAENAAGDKVTSDPMQFQTVKDEIPPAITKVNNESTLYPGEEARIQTIVSWETDETAFCQFFFHQNIAASEDEVSSFLEEANPVERHVQVITTFSPSTVYKFWVECRDKTGNRSRSDDFVLFTPAKEKSIIDIILENFEGSFGWVKNLGK